MTPNTDSSKEIRIPKEFRNWAKLYADGNSIDAHPKIRGHLNAELYQAIINTYRHLHPSPSPSGWIDVKDRTPDTIDGKDYSENVFVICDGKLEVMSYGWVDAEPVGGWVWSNCYGDIRGDSEWDDEYKPTHWMPLPKPPTTSGDKGIEFVNR